MKIAGIITVSTLSGFSTLFAVDHSPVWNSQSSLTYNLRDLDNFNPLGYGYTRWGNIMDEESSSSSPLNITLTFTERTQPHDPTNTNQDTWDLFLSEGTNNLLRYDFPTAPSIWDWSNGELNMTSSAAVTLFRYLHFEAVPKDPNGFVLPDDANKLIILIHGWNPNGNSDPYAGGEFVALYDNLIEATSATDWTVFKYDWAADADTGEQGFLALNAIQNSTEAAEHGHQHGQHLGDALLSRNPSITNIQLIAHSAGAWIARGAARHLMDLNPNIRVEVTLLDPFMPNELLLNDTSLDKSIISNLDETLGNSAYLLENYFVDDIAFGTQETFSWDSNRGDLNFETYNSSAPSKYEGHSGPILWYADTIDDATNGMLADLLSFDLATYGWRRSMFQNEPIITAAPEKIDINIGAEVSLTVAATTRDQQRFPSDSLSPPMSYIWLKWNGTNWQTLDDQTSNTLQLPEFAESDAGIYGMLAINSAGLAATDTIEVSAITFSSWISKYPSIPVNLRGNEDDFDQDGYVNLLEYALGMDPTIQSQTPTIDFSLEEERLSLSYDRLRGDVTYAVEASVDLSNWDSADVNQGETGLGRITAWILKGNEPRRFLQLRIEAN